MSSTAVSWMPGPSPLSLLLPLPLPEQLAGNLPARLLVAPNAASVDMLSSFYLGSNMGATSFLLSTLQIQGRVDCVHPAVHSLATWPPRQGVQILPPLGNLRE